MVLTLLLIVLIKPIPTYTQNIQPAWQKFELSSYCVACEIMDAKSKGVWVAFWRIPKQTVKLSLESSNLNYIETDSSLIFEQDAISKHEMIFKDDKFVSVISTHIHDIDFGITYLDYIKNRYSSVHDDKSIKIIGHGDGVEYSWESLDCNGHGKVISTMLGEMIGGIDYRIITTNTIVK